MRRIPLTLSFALIAAAAALPSAIADDVIIQRFSEPVDAISVALPSADATAEVSYKLGGEWSAWTAMAAENEQDPALLESILVIFPEGVKEIRLRSTDGITATHPIRVSDGPTTTLVAAAGGVSGNRVISRKEWGADESLLYTSKPAGSSAGQEVGDNGGGAATSREQECLDAQTNYPQEFKVAKTVTTDENGKRLLWPRQYSKKVSLIVVHHTAAAVGGDERSAAERVRAIYAYHAQSRGWGDVGYHYLIDEDGKIYEGKSGGKYVVAGHAYCNNINSVGVALLGNFDVEKPSQAQMKALQWLLADLARQYDIDLDKDVTFHGKTMPAIVGHKDLLSTDCPGYYAYKVLGQIRKNVAAGELTKSVVFPAGPKKASSSSSRRTASRSSVAAVREGITPLGDTTLTGRPGSQVLLSVRYANGKTVGRKGSDAASVARDEPTIGIWQDMNGTYERVRDSLTLPQAVPPDGTLAIRLKVQFPQAEGTYQFSLNGIRYTLNAKGRRAPAPRGQTTPAELLPKPPRYAPLPLKSAGSSSRARAASSSVAMRRSGDAVKMDDTVRIRLTKVTESATLTVPEGSLVDGKDAKGSVFLFRDGDECIAAVGRERVAAGIVRIVPGGDGITTIASVREGPNRYRGTMECRIDGDQLVLIDELPLETYLAGLSEEPDTEPWEKQRAFAVAARTYAAYYLADAHRKFPSRSYDGSDSPAEFQAYAGVAFEDANPRWLKAVKDTAHEVLAVDGELIRPPYFSASDGRTLSPKQAGWNDFPFAELYSAKADPWCEGMTQRGHGVGMSGCGAEGQANEGRTAEEILGYYYPGAEIAKIKG